MKKTVQFLALFFMITSIFSSYKSTAQNSDKNSLSEVELLVQYLETNGNFINTNAPALILADEIKENLKNKKYLVIDIRSEGWFDYGHIKNATNVKGPELLNYFQNSITPYEFNKITVVCYSGQSAAYYTSLLRLYGYNNVYSMKWGMSSWASEFAENVWVKNSKSELESELEKIANPIPDMVAYPKLTTGKIEALAILKTRIVEAFAKPYKEFIIKAPIAFENPSDYYVVNYVNEDRYNFGHLKGAVQYQPKTSLLSTTNLFTLPIDKKVLISCDSGQSAAYVVAYLQILGYNVGNLAYGANSFMNSTLVEKGWNGFNEKEIKNYPIVE